MKVKSIIKKVTALALTAALALGLAPTFGGIVIASRAESGTVEPSAQVYAAVDVLKGETFKPGTDGMAETVGKLRFGKVGDKAIEWYILGHDEQLKDKDDNTDNIAIFAADHIGDILTFNPSLTEYKYSGDGKKDEKYVKGNRAEGDSLAYNHYGESDVRAELRKMSGDEGTDKYNYFTTEEKAMMQKTKVLSHEVNDEDKLYTTSDKLYLPSGKENYDGTAIVYIGNVSDVSEANVDVSYEYKSKALSTKIYWRDRYEWCWLRSPGFENEYELIAELECGYIYSSNVSYKDSGVGGFVRPASNLNLANVLFASAAEASSASESGEVSTIDRGTDTAPNAAMTLRLRGDNEEVKTVLGGTIGVVKLVDDKVEVTKGTTAKKVTLIIQGKDDDTDTDWYYAKTITTDTTVTAENIEDHTGADLTRCKIWLETEGTGRMIYAVDTTSHVHSYDDTWTKISCEQHAHLCTAGDKCTDLLGSAKDKEAHTYNDDNVCTKCGYRKDDHVVTYVKEQPATSTAVGYKEHFECSHCDKWFIYPAELGVLIDKPKSYFEIPATGDSSSRNSDRYKKDTSSSSGGSGGSSGGSGISTNVSSISGWSQDTSGRWWYTDAARGRLYGWILDNTDGKWYYVDTTKGRLYGWFYYTEDGYWYYLDANTGAMLTGWQLIGGKQYYFAPAPAAATYTFDTSSSKWVYSNAANLRPFGSMYANTTTPDNHQVDADGVKVQ